ncbi:hypothetical protein KKA69_00660 [Patescibacteria group bacterium]|nr:hypothetical protein [Patescibacteria group bacterium]
MNKNYPFNELRERISMAQKVIVALPKSPYFDQVAAALALAVSLEESGKNVSVLCPTPMTVEYNHLVGVNKITNKVQGRDLLITFNYSAEDIEKVSYNDDNNKPNILVQPKSGSSPLSPEAVSYSYSGTGADLIITIGLKNANQLNFAGLNPGENFIMNFDIDPANSQFGQVNIIDSEAASYSEAALAMITGSGLSFAVDSAQNVISGIWAGTQGLSSSRVQADTFEAISICLRTGAQKPAGNIERKELQGQKASLKEENQDKDKKEEKSENPPADWFEPKIFKGTDLSQK